MTSDQSKNAIVSLAVPLVMLILSISFVFAEGSFDADPDYGYLLNGLNILHFHSPGHIDHPGTPLHVLQELGGWETPSMVRRHAHLAANHLAAYAGKVDLPTGTNPSQQHSA